MRFVIHTQYYPPEMGAPQARLSDLAKRFVGQGHQVYVLTAMPNYPQGRIHSGYGGFLRREEQDGVSIIRTFIYPTKSVGAVRRLANYFSFVFSSLLIGAFLLPRVDFILTESPPLFLGITGWILSRLKGARWILNLSDLWLESLRTFGVLRDRSLLDRMLRGLSLFLYHKAWLVTGQSEEIVTEIQRQVPSGRVYHLSNGVDVSSFHPKKRDKAIRQHYLRNGEVGFVYAGLHGFFQGLDQIIVAADRLRDEPVRFLFFGEGSEKETLVTMAQDRQLTNVGFHAPIPKDRVATVLASMDVAIIPLKKEIRGSVPSKIYEAMASNMPILLVANGEARRIVEKSGAGIAVNPGDTEGLLQAVRTLASEPAECARMGHAGRVAAENSYNRTKIAENFEAFLLGKGGISMQSRLETGGLPREEPEEMQKGMDVHRVEGKVIYASRGYRILRSPDAGETWVEDGEIPVTWWRKVIDSNPLMRRMSRGGVVGVWPQTDGSRLCVVPKMVTRAEAGSSIYRCVLRVDKGSRPLNLCQGKNGEVYWGEYFLNLRRSETVRIFGSKDKGKNWEVVYTFPKGTICHIHRIVYDPFADAILVCTGDRNHEVAILRTTNGFRTLEPIVQGNQQYRTTSLIPMKESILYGTDNPNGDNYVMAINRENGCVERVQELPGPVLYGCQVGEVAVFGTMVEKKDHEVTLWAGNEKAFRLVAHFNTRKATQFWREAAGYSTVMLPDGPGRWPHLFLTPIGTQKYSNSLLRINLEKVMKV